MRNDSLLQKVKEAGFETIDDFVKANIDYLPKRKKNLFNTIVEMKKELYKAKGYERYSQRL